MKFVNLLFDVLYVMVYLVGQDGLCIFEQLVFCLLIYLVVICCLLVQLYKVGLVCSIRGYGGGSQLVCVVVVIILYDVYLVVGVLLLVQVGICDFGGGCLIQQLVNSVLLEGVCEVQCLFEQCLWVVMLDKFGVDFVCYFVYYCFLEGYYEF